MPLVHLGREEILSPALRRHAGGAGETHGVEHHTGAPEMTVRKWEILTTNDVWDTALALQLRDASDLLIAGQGRVGPLASRIVISMALSWVAVNVVMAYAGGLLQPGAGDAPVSWEAHLAGFAVGALLIPAFGWLAARR